MRPTAMAIGLALCAGPATAETAMPTSDCPVANLRTYADTTYCVASETWPVDLSKSPIVGGVSGSPTMTAAEEPKIETCFRPEGPSCEAMLIRQIDGAKSQIRVSIYEWTLKSLGAALVRAKSRGVDVAVVVDKAAVRAPNAPAQTFEPHVNHAAGGLNHDKFVVIDGQVLCTGSFNFTWSAEHLNAENAICLRSADVAARYLQHWEAGAR